MTKNNMARLSPLGLWEEMMFRVYGDMLSGNCYKVKLLMKLLGIEHKWLHVDILNRETHTPQFKMINANAKIPVLQIGESDYLSESNAILNFLADGTRFLPDSGIEKARVLQWQFFEQYSHEPYVAVARYISKYLGMPKERLDEFQSKQEGGHTALSIMDNQLAKTHFIVNDAPTIADISLYAYTHVAGEGGFELEGYPHILNWLRRIEALPNYVAMSRENE